MGEYDTLEAILNRAIEIEVQAARMYEDAASRSTTDPIRERLLELAAQEWGHKAKLEDIQAGNVRWALRQASADAVS